MLSRLKDSPDKWLKIPLLLGGLGTSNGETSSGSSRKSSSENESKKLPNVEGLWQMDLLNKDFLPENALPVQGLIHPEWSVRSDAKKAVT